MSNFRHSFGTTFRAIRKSKNLNQDAVAERAGLSTSYISDVERGVANPKLDTIESLAKGIGVSARDLFDFEARPKNAQEIKEQVYELLSHYSDEEIISLYNKLLNIFTT